MKRSVPRFLICFAIVVATGVGLIFVVPTALDPEVTIQQWIPTVLGALFAASAYVAWFVRPRWAHSPKE